MWMKGGWEVELFEILLLLFPRKLYSHIHTQCTLIKSKYTQITNLHTHPPIRTHEKTTYTHRINMYTHTYTEN